MAKRRGRHTTAKLSGGALRNPKPGKHCDGGGLWLYVKPTRAAFWVFRYRMNGRDQQMGLGPLWSLSAPEARELALHYRKLKREGKDPLQERATAKASDIPTFKDCAATMIEAKRHEWRNDKHAQQWANTLKEYVYPVLGAMAVDAVETAHVLKVLEPIWTSKTETATRIRQRIESVLDYAKARGYRRGENPARWRGHLDKLLAKPARVKKVRHHPALPHAKLPDFMGELAKQEGIAARALTFAILTAARTGEIRGAKPEEIDGAVWQIPAERMKAHRPHRVPLSEQALELVGNAPRLNGNPYLFAGQLRGRMLSNGAMTAVLKRMGRADLTVHGFRSTFRDWCAEQTNFPRELAEAALAHTLKDKAEAAYQRGDMLDRRSKLMQAWADYCLPDVKKGVIPIRKGAG